MLLATLGVIIGLLVALAMSDVFPHGSLGSGFSFVPALLPVILAGAAGVLLLLSNRPGLASMLLALAGSFFLAFGDWTWSPPAEESKSATAFSSKSFSIMALNVQYFTEGLFVVADAIKQQDADLLLLCETEGVAQKRQLFAELMRPYSVHLSALGDTAILSRLPVKSFHEVLLPTHQPSLSDFNEIKDQAHRPRRSFLHAVVMVNDQAVNVLALRFIAGRGRSHAPYDQLVWGRYLLGEQAREIEAVHSYIQALSGPVVFGGDLNATHGSFTIKRLKTLARDAYLDRHHWGAMTFKTKFSWQKHKNLPALRLDYLFANEGLMTLEAKVLAVNVSDHFPVYARFQLGTPDANPVH